MAAADPSTFHPSINRYTHQFTAVDQQPMDISDHLRSPDDYTARDQSMAAADPSPFHQSLKRSMAEAEAEADRSPSHTAIIDFLRDPGDHAAWRSATGDQEIPRLPLLWSLSRDRTALITLDGLTNIAHARAWLWSLSEDGTTKIALDGVTKIAQAKVHRIPLPAHLHGYYLELFFSIGHCLLLEKRGSLSGIYLYNPFSSQFVRLPHSPISGDYTYEIISVTVATDTKCPIALAALNSCGYPLAYTYLDCNSDSTWINLLKHIPYHSKTDRLISFEYPFLYADGLFYGVDATGTRVYALDFSAAPEVIRFDDITFDLPDNYSHPDFNQALCSCCHQSASLIYSGSSLFLVRWMKDLRWKDGVKHSRHLEVFCFDAPRKAWVLEESLVGFSFFIGKNLSISMSTVDFPELKSNRVYLCFDPVVPISGNPYSSHHYDQFCEHLFYDLGDRSWGSFHEALLHFQSDCTPLFTVGMLPPAKGASTGLARAAQRTANKQCRKRKTQRGQPRTGTTNEASEKEL